MEHMGNEIPMEIPLTPIEFRWRSIPWILKSYDILPQKKPIEIPWNPIKTHSSNNENPNPMNICEIPLKNPSRSS